MKIVPRVRVEVAVNPTESLAKVKVACLNLFPDLTFLQEGDVLVGETRTLERFRTLLREQRIRDTARKILIQHRDGDTIRFSLNKQAAHAGRVSFGTDAPLGDLAVTIEDEDLDALIDRVAESTLGRRLSAPPDRSAGT